MVIFAIHFFFVLLQNIEEQWCNCSTIAYLNDEKLLTHKNTIT